jgi:hypothetical protein
VKSGMRIAALTAAISSIFVVSAARANASSLTPTTFDFGNQTVGKSSPTHPFVLNLTQNCTDFGFPVGTICFPTFVAPSIALTGPFTQTSDCPFLLSGPASCTSDVVFKPTQPGPATGTMTTGTGVATLRGNGVAAPKVTNGNPGSATGTTAQQSKKKCHKKHKHGRVLLRKCHKHHHHHG